ncbi:hypothetical protein BG846_05282 [Streptomyces fradiae ATCC 10745 = DSM 40063]|uniref:Uncharacterized protein n=1 Tax=Streptomyces fradiae ATCC 10745 = DSM 40063 TaxID=1319510 RepID=A0A1Y2NP53_STRFR|nr:hypothetical protein BG846_05282 [Streptomyces fradiae ATCC 10745 = DSM 40063]
MITSIAKSAGLGCSPTTSWAQPRATASSSITSGTRRRNATTSPNSRTMTTATPRCGPSSGTVPTHRAENPESITAQKLSTPVGCLRRKS